MFVPELYGIKPLAGKRFRSATVARKKFQKSAEKFPENSRAPRDDSLPRSDSPVDTASGSFWDIQLKIQKIETDPRAVTDGEKGKVSTGIGVYVALLGYDLLQPLDELANPAKEEGLTLVAARGRRVPVRVEI
jgi:hypothetical protein